MVVGVEGVEGVEGVKGVGEVVGKVVERVEVVEVRGWDGDIAPGDCIGWQGWEGRTLVSKWSGI